MTKKIKDLTLSEAQNLCERQGNCNRCPLVHRLDKSTILDCPVSYEEWYLEKEVEIDESNND